MVFSHICARAQSNNDGIAIERGMRLSILTSVEQRKKAAQCAQGNIKIVTITITHLNVSLLYSDGVFFSRLDAAKFPQYCYKCFPGFTFFSALWFAITVEDVFFLLLLL